ncbi:hypothetical protein Trydic_g17126 [Trypoxylus dichotomus]
MFPLLTEDSNHPALAVHDRCRAIWRFVHSRRGVEIVRGTRRITYPRNSSYQITEEYDARKNESRGNVQGAMFAAKKQHGWKRHPRSKNTEGSGNGMENPKKEENFRYKCHRCRKVGHKASECSEKKVDEGAFSKEIGPRNGITGNNSYRRPEQNGVSECKNRTLLDMAHCLMMQTELPSQFWAEAVYTANYIRNRCPTRSLNSRTPYEICIISEQLNDFAPKELVESPENSKEVIYFPVTNDPISEVDPDENNPEVVVMKRGPGRPGKERSSSRGPRKVYNTISQSHEATFTEEAEEAFLAEIPIKLALNGPDAET